MLFITIFASSCDGTKTKKSENKISDSKTILDIDERLKAVDSLAIVFYKNPYGRDSIRYTRYFTQVSTVGSAEIRLLQQQLAEKAIKQEKYRNCRGEGKFWCYSKGKIFQTVYFSMRCNDCCHVYLIKDGFFYYSPILKELSDWLQTIKHLATEPVNGAISM